MYLRTTLASLLATATLNIASPIEKRAAAINDGTIVRVSSLSSQLLSFARLDFCFFV